LISFSSVMNLSPRIFEAVLSERSHQETGGSLKDPEHRHRADQIGRRHRKALGAALLKRRRETWKQRLSEVIAGRY
jgi:hypothetical protein